MTTKDDTLADDLLNGGAEIAAFLGTNTREIYHLAKTQRLPIGRLGRKLIASKSQLARHVEQITAPTIVCDHDMWDWDIFGDNCPACGKKMR